MEAKVCAANRNRGTLRMFCRSDVGLLSVIGAINPVVNPKPRVRDPSLRIDFRETSVQDLSYVCFTIAIRVFHEKNVWRARDDEAALPAHDAAHLQDMVRKNAAPHDFAVAISFQEANAGPGRFSWWRICRVVQHFGN